MKIKNMDKIIAIELAEGWEELNLDEQWEYMQEMLAHGYFDILSTKDLIKQRLKQLDEWLNERYDDLTEKIIDSPSWLELDAMQEMIDEVTDKIAEMLIN